MKSLALSKSKTCKIIVMIAILLSLLSILNLQLKSDYLVYADQNVVGGTGGSGGLGGTHDTNRSGNTGSLDEVVDSNQADTSTPITSTPITNPSSIPSSTQSSSSFLQGLNKAADLSPEIEGTQKIIAPLRYGVAYVVQVLSFVIITGLALSVVLDLTYLAVPPLRNLLSNGYVGSALPAGQQQSSTGVPQAQFNPSLYFKQSQSPAPGQAPAPGPSPSSIGVVQAQSPGRIQFISKAALDAVSNEGTLDPKTSKTRGLVSLYMKGMGLKLIVIPILLILVLTGSLTNLGFTIADLIVAMLRLIGESIGGI